MSERYDFDSLTGKAKGAVLGIARKASMSYSFVRQVESTDHAGETPLQNAVRDKASQRKREAKQRPHTTSDLSMDNGLRERRTLLNGITRKHKLVPIYEGNLIIRIDTVLVKGKLAAKPSRGLGMASFMRDVVRQGKRRHWKSVRVLNNHNRAGALLAVAVATDTVSAMAPLLRNHVRVIKAKDRGLL